MLSDTEKTKAAELLDNGFQLNDAPASRLLGLETDSAVRTTYNMFDKVLDHFSRKKGVMLS